VSGASPEQERQAATARRLLARIPDGATVGVSGGLIAQLTARTTVYLFPDELRRRLRPDRIATTTDAEPPARIRGRRHRIRRRPDSPAGDISRL
jgi:hypothetical protein